MPRSLREQSHLSISRTFSASSISVNLTSITSLSVVCTVRPTNVPSTGNSRWPRSSIAIKRYIQRAHGNLLLFDLLNHFAQPLGDGDSATANSDQAQAVDTTVFLQDFVS